MSPFGSPCDRASARTARHSGSVHRPSKLLRARAATDRPTKPFRWSRRRGDSEAVRVYSIRPSTKKRRSRGTKPLPMSKPAILITLSSPLSSSWFQHRTFGQSGVPWGGALDETASQVFVRTASKLAEEKRDLAPRANPGEDPSHSAA